jgi:hypothetical protein
VFVLKTGHRLEGADAEAPAVEEDVGT